MIIKDALAVLETAQNPVFKSLHEGAISKILVMTLKAGMSVKEHKSDVSATLIVVSGKVNYRNPETTTTLEKYDNLSVPAEELHAVTALEDSVCLLIKG